jgi:DNA-binding LacI/PurR family transcriptional regulator
MAKLIDIARRAGVSKSTVSNVVHGRAIVAERTRERVERAIAELRYHPNIVARALKTQSSRAFGVLIPDLTNPFYAQLVVSVERAAHALNYAVLAIHTEYQAQTENEAGRVVIERQVDGVIIGGISLGSKLPKALLDHDIPVVLASLGEPDDERLGVIDHDDFASMERAVEYLHGLGHRRFAFASQQFPEESGQRRRLGFQNALVRRNLQPVDLGKATAVLSHNDLIAIAMIQRLEQNGLRVPEDVSIIGHDDIPMAAHSRIQLSTIRSDAVFMGRRAVGLLVAAAREGRHVHTRELQPSPLVIRSTASTPRT